MFELKTITECELTSFVGRTQREGKEDVPAVSFRLALSGVSNTMLDMFSATLRPAIYTAVEGQEQLPGVEPSTPLLRSKDVTHLAPEFRYEGWKVWVARGLDDDALHMERVKVDDFKFAFFEGGKMDFDFRLSTADVDEEGAGMLWGRQKRKVFVRIEAPELPAPAIDGTKGHPGAAGGSDERQGDLLTPEDALAGAVGGPDGDDDTDDDGSGHPDSGDDEQAELEAGMAASLDAAGVKPRGRGSRKPVGAH